MKLTLLELVQRTLSAIDSNNVSSVSDTVEAEQIVFIVQRTYEEIASKRHWDWLYKEGTLTPKGVTSPTTMVIPDNTISIHTIRYNKETIKYLPPMEFKEYIDSVSDRTQSNPKFWTSYNDTEIEFDTYDSTYSNLLEDKSYIYYVGVNSALINDTDIPDMPTRFHSVLLNGVLDKAFEELKRDSTSAAVYRKMFLEGMARMQKYGRIVQAADHNSGGEQNYGRKRH